MEPHVEEQLNFTINKNIEMLIQQIEPLTKQNQANVNMSRLLKEFYKNVIQSEKYLHSGIFTINFGKAAIFLDHAFYIYSKQIDLLWEMSINSQRRHLSYDVDSEQKLEAQKKLEEKAQKGRRGRKKKVAEDPKKEIDWNRTRLKIKKYCRRALANIVEFDFESEMDIAEMDPSTLETFANVKVIKNWDKMYPEKYVMWPYVESNYTTDIDEDCRYNTGNLATNYMDFLFPEIQRKFIYNYGDNKKINIIGCDVSDKALQRYIIERGLNPCDFTTETWQNFKKYLDKYLTSGPEEAHLAEQRKKLCPRRPSILVTRLPDDVVQQHLKQDEPTPGPSRNDSGYSETMDTLEFPDFSEESNVLPKELSTPVTDRLTPANNTQDPEDSFRPKGRPQRTCVLESAFNLKKNEEEYNKIKRKKSCDENDEFPPKKRLRKKEIFKWLKTTTVALKRFEKFFYEHYLTEEGEGDIEMPEFSSDEESDHDTSQTEVLQTSINATQTTTDSGFVDESHLSQNSEKNQSTQSQILSDSMQEDYSDNRERLEEPSNDPNDEVTESDEMLQRYVQWNEYIREELKRYGQNDFDIHEYGTKIINKLSDDKPVRFSEVLPHDSIGNVARYFVAALQLVNTENVQFVNWTQGEVATDLELSLLSRERHHEHLDNYKAPSKEMLKEKIKNLQNVDQNTNVIMNNERRVDHTTARKTYKRIKLSKNS